MQPDRFFITTSIPYVNAAPHIGHALEFVQADAFARYHRLRGDDTWFLTGTDDNSLNNVLAAEREGIGVRALVDRNARSFIDLACVLAISNDDFIRTSIERRHIEGAQKFWQACVRAGDIYRRTYRGLYCVGCEQEIALSLRKNSVDEALNEHSDFVGGTAVVAELVKGLEAR